MESDKINWTENCLYEVNRNYSIDNNNSIFAQNADLYIHGFNSADLGMGSFCNAVILNSILDRKIFDLETDTTF